MELVFKRQVGTTTERVKLTKELAECILYAATHQEYGKVWLVDLSPTEEVQMPFNEIVYTSGAWNEYKPLDYAVDKAAQLVAGPLEKPAMLSLYDPANSKTVIS